MIIMRCEECGMRDFRFDERLGEKVCNVCGLVAIYEAFDESVTFADGFTIEILIQIDWVRLLREKVQRSLTDGIQII